MSAFFQNLAQKVSEVFSSQTSSTSPVIGQNKTLFKINQKSDFKDVPHEPRELRDFDWFKTVLPSDKKYDNDGSIKLIRKDFDDNKEMSYTHAGFVCYLYYCWAKEIGAELRPDILFYRVLSDIAKDVLNNPSSYKFLFTEKDEKTTIKVETIDVVDVNPESLVNLLRNLVPNKEFIELVVDTSFASEPTGAKLARFVAFCQMGVPFYSYCTAMCGIPSVEIKGIVDEWKLLHQQIQKMVKIFNTPELKYMRDFLNNYANIIANIIYHSFGGEKMSDDVKIMNNSGDEFYRMMFNYEENPQCGSGHVPPIVYGWVVQLYLAHWKRTELVQKTYYDWKTNKDKTITLHQEIDLSDFSNDITYVPYTNEETGRMFFKAIGLVWSKYYQRNPNSVGMKSDDYLSAQYGSVIYEVLSKELYDKISMNDPNGSSKFMF